MNTSLRLVDGYHNLHDQERDALELQIIQQALDGSMLHKVATTTSLKEVWSILETKYSERGRNNLSNVSTLEEAFVSEEELPKEHNEGASVSEAELPEEQKEEASVSEAELLEEKNEGAFLFEAELPEEKKEGAFVCEAKHEKIAETDDEAISTTTCIDEMIRVVFVDDNKGSTSMMIDQHFA